MAKKRKRVERKKSSRKSREKRERLELDEIKRTLRRLDQFNVRQTGLQQQRKVERALRRELAIAEQAAQDEYNKLFEKLFELLQDSQSRALLRMFGSLSAKHKKVVIYVTSRLYSRRQLHS